MISNWNRKNRENGERERERENLKPHKNRQHFLKILTHILIEMSKSEIRKYKLC